MPLDHHYRDVLHVLYRHPDHVWRDVREVGLPTFLVLLGSWVAACALFEAVGRWGGFSRVQSDAPRHWRAALKMNILNWAILAFLSPFSGPVLVVLFGVHAAHPMPTPLQAVGTWLIVTVVFDAWFYAYHRGLHANRGLMRGVHSWHHKFHAPFALVGYAMHPVELALNGIGAFLGTLVARYLLFTRENPMSIEFVWVLLIVSHVHTAGIHCGYDLNFLGFVPTGWIPYTATAKWHDQHHSMGNVNFGGVTRLWDVMLGTDYVDKSHKSA